MYIVYALYNPKHDKIYIGQTEDLARRLELHANGTFRQSFTARMSGKWILIYQESVENRRAALVREKQLKSFRGREFIRTHIPR